MDRVVSNEEKYLPKKILQIYNLGYELPDDFDGDIIKALESLTEYLKNAYGDKGVPNKDISSEENEINGSPKVRMEFGIFELVDAGKGIYKLK